MKKFIKETLETTVTGGYDELRAQEVENAYDLFVKDKNDVINQEELKSFLMEVSGINYKAQDKLKFRKQRHDKIEQLIREREEEHRKEKESKKFMGFPLAGPEDDISELLSRDLLQQHSGGK